MLGKLYKAHYKHLKLIKKQFLDSRNIFLNQENIGALFSQNKRVHLTEKTFLSVLRENLISTEKHILKRSYFETIFLNQNSSYQESFEAFAVQFQLLRISLQFRNFELRLPYPQYLNT